MTFREVRSLPTRDRLRGFTLIELVMVMVIVAALAVFALPKAVDVSTFTLSSYCDKIQNATTYANRLALAQRRPVTVSFSSTGVSVAYTAGGTIAVPVIDPSSGSAFSLNCPSGLSPCITNGAGSSVTFNANNSGTSSTSSGAAFQVTVSSGSFTQNFTIENTTGFVRRT